MELRLSLHEVITKCAQALRAPPTAGRRHRGIRSPAFDAPTESGGRFTPAGCGRHRWADAYRREEFLRHHRA